jgi:predicted nucleotidyltransferase
MRSAEGTSRTSVRRPLPFEELWRRAEEVDLGAVAVRIAAIPDLIAMKRSVDRLQDREDIARLEEILALRESRR